MNSWQEYCGMTDKEFRFFKRIYPNARSFIWQLTKEQRDILEDNLYKLMIKKDK